MTVPKADQDAIDRRSLHERIAADLRDEIMSGELPPGAKLPSTAQLKERFTASNATVQKALQLLKDEGLAVGRAGAAVTVREHRQRTMRPAAYMAPAAPGEPYRWISLGLAEEVTDPGLARQLFEQAEQAIAGLPPDHEAWPYVLSAVVSYLARYAPERADPWLDRVERAYDDRGADEDMVEALADLAGRVSGLDSERAVRLMARVEQIARVLPPHPEYAFSLPAGWCASRRPVGLPTPDAPNV